jgi:hypothetical protein
MLVSYLKLWVANCKKILLLAQMHRLIVSILNPKGLNVLGVTKPVLVSVA